MKLGAVGWTKVILTLFWGGVIATVFVSAVGSSPLRPSSDVRKVQIALLPEGWSFFTRAPKEPKTLLYTLEADRMELLTFTNTSARSLFGASRVARSLDVETAELLSPLLETSWRACSEGAERCAATSPTIELTNWSPTKMVCGEVVAVRSRPVPWAWSRSPTPVEMNSDVVRLRVDCEAPAAALPLAENTP